MQAAQNTFVSSTSWTERIGPVASLATISKHRREHVARHLIRVGELVQAGWQTASQRAGLPIDIRGISPLAHFSIDCDRSQAAHTIFTQEMLERGFLANNSFYATYAHQDHHVDSYMENVEDVFLIIAQAIERNDLMEQLKGPIAHSGFRRLT